MRYHFIYAYALAALFISCQTNEKQSTTEESEAPQDNLNQVANDTIAETIVTSENNYEDVELFEYYHNLCAQKDWPALVKGTKIIRAYEQYPNATYESALEWEVISIPYCTDELIFLHLQSFEEGKRNNYQVAITNSGLITQFELTGEHQAGEVQMKMWDKNTVQVTIINENAECRNYFMSPEQDVFQGMQYESSIGFPTTTPADSFQLTINERTRFMQLHTPHRKDSDFKVYFDLYEGNNFYYRLPPHAVSDFALEEVTSVFIRDINGDRKDDITIYASAITGIGPEGAVPFGRVSVYFQTDRWIFQNEQSFDALINVEMNPEKIAEVFETQYL